MGFLLTILAAVILMALIIWGLSYVPMEDKLRGFVTFVVVAVVVVYLLMALFGAAPMVRLGSDVAITQEGRISV